MDLFLKVPGCGVSKTNEDLPSTAVVQIPYKTDVTDGCKMWGVSKAAARCQLSG